MPKKRRSREKGIEKEVMTNFPEEGKPIALLSPRYLAVVTALIMVFSAFASLLVRESITGQITSPTVERWREEGLMENWRRQSGYTSEPNNLRNEEGWKVAPPEFRCPIPEKDRFSPPLDRLSTANQHGCYNAGRIGGTGDLRRNLEHFVCSGREIVNGRYAPIMKPCSWL